MKQIPCWNKPSWKCMALKDKRLPENTTKTMKMEIDIELFVYRPKLTIFYLHDFTMQFVIQSRILLSHMLVSYSRYNVKTRKLYAKGHHVQRELLFLRANIPIKFILKFKQMCAHHKISMCVCVWCVTEHRRNYPNALD